MNKQKELEKLFEEIKAFELPKNRGDGPMLVFGEGSPDAEIMFIGEAPGYYEAQVGRPFVGNAGKLLDKMITSIDLRREDAYITNVLRFRPPNNRDPLPEEVEEYTPFLTRHIEIIQPKLIVSLGRFAMNYFIPQAKISRDHGRALRSGKWVVYPVYHPAAALRSGDMMQTLQADFQKIPQLLAQISKKEDNKDNKTEEKDEGSDKGGQLSLLD